MLRARGGTLTLISAIFALAALGTSSQASAARSTVPSRTHLRSETTGWIAAEAQFLSGRPLRVVCGATAGEWALELKTVGLPPAQAGEFYGFSLIDQGEMDLSPYVCQGLQLGADAKTRAANQLQVAWSVDVLLHESVHLARSTRDEALAEACARVQLPGELHRLFGVKYGSAEVRALTLAATWFRRTQASSYQGGTCPAPSSHAAP